MNKENMPEQQREKDLIDKISEFFINKHKDIAYSIRKRGGMRLKFGIRFLMGMLVGLFALF